MPDADQDLPSFPGYETIEKMDHAIVQELNEAIQQAEATAPADPQEVFNAVYAESAQEMGL